MWVTQKDLKKEVEAGRFREDLYYRIHVLEERDLCGQQNGPFVGGSVQEGCGFCQEGLGDGQTQSPASFVVKVFAGVTFAEARK